MAVTTRSRLTTGPDPEPTRDGVSFPTGLHHGRDDLITLPERPRRASERRWRAAYNADPVVVFERTSAGHLSRARHAGPVTAQICVRGTTRNAVRRGDPLPVFAIFWAADAQGQDEPGTDAAMRYTRLVRDLAAFPSATAPPESR